MRSLHIQDMFLLLYFLQISFLVFDLLVDLVDIIHSGLLADLQGLVLLWALGWLLLLSELEVLVYLILVFNAGSPFSAI